MGGFFLTMIKTIISSELPIDEQFRIQKNVIKNGTGTKRVCIVTGTHGDELEGQMVCYELVRIIKEISLTARLRSIRLSIRSASTPYNVASRTSTST